MTRVLIVFGGTTAERLVSAESARVILANVDREQFDVQSAEILANGHWEFQGDFYLNEINTIPGFTAGSMYPRLWEHAGYSIRELITALINDALAKNLRPRLADETLQLNRVP